MHDGVASFLVHYSCACSVCILARRFWASWSRFWVGEGVVGGRYSGVHKDRRDQISVNGGFFPFFSGGAYSYMGVCVFLLYINFFKIGFIFKKLSCVLR